MPLTTILRSLASALEMLVLSWTSHARLARAEHPVDFDLILKRTIREVKFHSETLLAVLFFMGTSSQSTQPLISWALACLLYTLITYTALEAMSGDALHKWIDQIPYGRVFLACFTKLPAISVLSTLCALALTRWNGIYTSIVMCTTFGFLTIAISVRAQICSHIVRIWKKLFLVYTLKGCKSIPTAQRGSSENNAAGTVIDDLGDNDADCDRKSGLDLGAVEMNPAALEMV